VVHSAEKAAQLQSPSVEPVICNVLDSEALRETFGRGKRAFLLNPPGNVGGDTNADEMASSRSITDALQRSGLEKIVVASTYGARPGDGIGDLTTLHDLEQRARASGIPTAINRGAYYFTNLDMLMEPAREGVVPTAFPADLKLPMVAPADLGQFAAERLASGIDDVGIAFIEGPERYSFNDVAAAFARHLGRDVSVQTTPRERWEESFRAVGFSVEAAQAFVRMTAATIEGTDDPEAPRRGSVTLDSYVADLVRRSGSRS
jgi:uncharacterized protein YbjT (DUF2867 family)